MKWYKIVILTTILYILGKIGTKIQFKAISTFRYYYFDILAPIWCIPLFGYLQKIFYWGSKRNVTLIEICGYIIIFSILFEYYFPVTICKGTSDIYDVVCYIGGGIITYLLKIAF